MPLREEERGEVNKRYQKEERRDTQTSSQSHLLHN
jgi:hypothetical protein